MAEHVGGCSPLNSSRSFRHQAQRSALVTPMPGSHDCGPVVFQQGTAVTCQQNTDEAPALTVFPGVLPPGTRPFRLTQQLDSSASIVLHMTMPTMPTAHKQRERITVQCL